MWLSKVYSGSIRGLSEVWVSVSELVRLSSTGSFTLENRDIVKLPMPKDLQSPVLTTTFFKLTSSCPAIFNKFDCKATSELVHGLTKVLHRDFSITICPEAILPRANLVSETGKEIKHLICIGSSIMSQCLPFLHAQGYTITNLTCPGWLATKANISALITEMSAVRISTSFIVVLDLFSNCSHRFL
jgi:hypothetical protein